MLKKMGNNNLVRLQKFMAECGVASRRKSEELIEMGKVKVNGHVAHIGDKINPKKDIVAVRGKKITKEERMYYIMLNKPRGYVTTVSDELGRKTVMDLVDCDARVYPVGRLDKDSEGLLILTAPCDINIILEEEGRVVLEFILREGRNRQIRKMCEAVGLQVARLKRISIGPVKLGMLQTGKTRRLTDNEVHKLLRSSNPATQEENK